MVEWPCACVVSATKVWSSFRLVAILFAWADPYVLYYRFPYELVLKISRTVMVSKRTSEAPRQDRDAKKPRILQKFLLDYTTDWPVLKPSTKGATFCYCCSCRLDFSIGHCGHDDCKRHVVCKLHKEYICRIAKDVPFSQFNVQAEGNSLCLKQQERRRYWWQPAWTVIWLCRQSTNSWKPSRKCFQTLKSPNVMHSWQNP